MEKMKINIKGVTLIELLVSISLLLILAVAFLPLLTNSYSAIFLSGEKNNTVNQAQSEVEKTFSTGTSSDPETDFLPATLVIEFGTESFHVHGNNVKVKSEDTYGEADLATFSFFVPD